MSDERDAPSPGSTTDAFLAVGLAGIAGLIRLIPHPFNMTPVNALGLFGGARLSARLAFVLPLLVMALSDLAIWAVKGWSPFNPFVYASLMLGVLLGRTLIRTNSASRIGVATLLCTLQFFLITNFGVWLGASDKPEKIPPGAAYVYDADSPYPIPLIRYARTPAGLASCYAQGLTFGKESLQHAPPLGFFGNLLLGDLIFSGLLFGAHAYLASRLSRPATGSALASSGRTLP